MSNPRKYGLGCLYANVIIQDRFSVNYYDIVDVGGTSFNKIQSLGCSVFFLQEEGQMANNQASKQVY